jgi:murein DD-endopeptidase MepM/ murein hydrolase activator NlpD
VRRFALLLPLAALLAFGSAGAAGPAHAPGAAATAWAIRVSPASGSVVQTAIANAPPASQPAVGGSFVYPSDGSIVSASSTTASASTAVTHVAAAKASATVTGLSIFGGELTADAVTAETSAGTGPSGAGGNALGSAVTNLKFQGQPVTATHVTLGDWGQLTIGAQGIDRSAPAGAKGYRGDVTELDIHLTADHDGLPANSEIQIGYAESAVQTAPPAAPPVTTTATTSTAATTPAPVAPQSPTAGDSPRDRAAHVKTPGGPRPLYHVQPKLTAGGYVFPVYGPSSYIDTYGASRADVSGGWHHGDDIFGQLGQPLVACATGTLFSVGWNPIGGNRLWLLDSQGNQFYYAHLSAYAAVAVNGAHVHAGEVIGFMGNTGDAQGTPYHLHFEIHPVSLLYLGYDGAVDPTPYLDAWRHQKDLPFPTAAGWAPVIPGSGNAPEPGAILLGMSDISTADGLDPASLRRALTPLKPAALMQTLVPTTPAPTKYPGRG